MNTTTTGVNVSGLTHCWVPTWGYDVSVAQVIGYCLTLTPFITVVVNVTALVCIVRVPKLKPNTRAFLFSLAICDTLVGLVIMPFRIFGMINSGLDNRTAMDAIICNIGNAVDVLLCCVIAMHLVVLAFDRYLATCRPFQLEYWLSRKTCVIFLVLTWILPAILTLALFSKRIHLSGINPQHQCRSHHVKLCHLMLSLSFAVIFTLICYILPAMIIVVCNRFTKKGVEKRQRVFTKLVQINTYRGSFNRRHFGTKFARTVIILTLCFLGCWLPYFVINIVDPLTSYRVPPYIWILVTWIRYSKSIISPILYIKASGVMKRTSKY